uniref:Uncharacterized protein n=1 Tax=Anguilla anguilla TaxID=7936 RepID=A0A0E9V8E9_ANGAN
MVVEYFIKPNTLDHSVLESIGVCLRVLS